MSGTSIHSRVMDGDEIYRLLPYSGSWRLLGEATILNDSVDTHIDWTDHPMCVGHFSDISVTPGVMVSEVFGQSAALHAYITRAIDNNLYLPVLQQGEIVCHQILPMRFQTTVSFLKEERKNTFLYEGAAQRIDGDSVAVEASLKIMFVKKTLLQRLLRQAR